MTLQTRDASIQHIPILYVYKVHTNIIMQRLYSQANSIFQLTSWVAYRFVCNSGHSFYKIPTIYIYTRLYTINVQHKFKINWWMFFCGNIKYINIYMLRNLYASFYLKIFFHNLSTYFPSFFHLAFWLNFHAHEKFDWPILPISVYTLSGPTLHPHSISILQSEPVGI